MTIGILQLGAGIRGRHWLAFLRQHPDFRLLAVVEPHPANRERARALAGEEVRWFEDLDGALAEVRAEAALIATPSALHAEHSLRCLEAGLVVLVEKPLATSVEEARTVIAKAKEVGRQLIVAENYRFFAAERTLKAKIAAGLIGKVDHIQFTDRRHMPRGSEGDWLFTMDYPQLQEIAIHHFDSLRAFLGTPRAVHARVWNPPWSHYAHGAASEAIIDFGDAQAVYLGTLMSHRFGCSIWIEGEEGVLWSNRKYVFFRPRGSRWFRPLRNLRVPPGDEKSYPQGGTTSLLNSLRDAVRHGTPAETRAEDNIWTLAMVEAGKRSDREGRRVGLAEVYPDPFPL